MQENTGHLDREAGGELKRGESRPFFTIGIFAMAIAAIVASGSYFSSQREVRADAGMEAVWSLLGQPAGSIGK